LRVRPKPEHTLGFEIQINDDDNGYSRDAKISWSSNSDTAWKSPRVFGELVLEGFSSFSKARAPTNSAAVNDKELAIDKEKSNK
jgi:hypothetical protein